MKSIVENLELVEADFTAANEIYDAELQSFVGRLALGWPDLTVFPVDIGAIYKTVLETVAREPAKSENWARTFGALSVCAALDTRPTSFRFDEAGDYSGMKGLSEFRTSRKLPVSETLFSEDVDSHIAFVLSENSQTAEMSIIKALHMVDFGIVRGDISPAAAADLFPLVVSADDEQLLKLRSDVRGTQLRIYGNVRKLSGAPLILGTVISTSSLEKSGIIVNSLSNCPPSSQVENDVETIHLSNARVPAVGLGITTAKRPHLGHAFLLAKSVAEAGPKGRILVELNDLGPRVAQAVSAYADARGMSFKEAADLIASGAAPVAEVEAAYKNRQKKDVPLVLPETFSLAENNAYYRELLPLICPGISMDLVANSDLRDGYKTDLLSLPGAIKLFGGSGMSLLSGANEGKAVVVESANELTAVGTLGALSTKYALTYVDSPRPIDPTTSRIFEDNGVGMSVEAGMGVSFDFDVASGSNGNTILIDQLVEIAAGMGFRPREVLPACRIMLSEAYYVRGDGKSINPNYATLESALAAFKNALGSLGDEPILMGTFQFVRVDKLAAQELLTKVTEGAKIINKPTVPIINMLQSAFTKLPLDSNLLQFARDNRDVVDVPKSIARKNLAIWNKIYTCNPDLLFGLVADVAKDNPLQANEIILGTELERMMVGMGYSTSQLPAFVDKLREAGNVYKLKL